MSASLFPGASCELSDETVAARVMAGETALYEILMRRYNQRLYRIARTILRNDGEAEDVMQEAYVRAYTHLHQYSGESKFATWLTKIAVHEALQRVRRRGRIESWEFTPEQEKAAMESGPPTASDPERETYEREVRAVLEDSIDALPDIYRAVFVLRAVESMEGPEVAECLGISVDAEKMRFFRARALLRRSLYRKIGAASRTAFTFHLSRCDRVVAAVLARIRGMAG